MKKLLITCFEPFGGDEKNASLEAVSRLPDAIGEYNVKKVCIPVAFGRAAEYVISKAEETAADAVICVGQAGGRDRITPETTAVNLRMARIPDNDGASPQNEKICEDGEDRLFSTFDAYDMASRIRSVGVPAEVSDDAGQYVCNDVLYSVLRHFRLSDTVAGFIHVPYCDLQETGGKPSLPIGDMVRGLTAAVETLSAPRGTDYLSLVTELRALTAGVPHRVANLANAAALLWERLEGINWVGFYLLEGGSLILGPFQGKPACISIPLGRGVCGTAAERDETQLVPDVHSFSGHIACDSASRSEIVVPLRRGGSVVGVLDVDSPHLGRFTESDAAGLEAVARVIEAFI